MRLRRTSWLVGLASVAVPASYAFVQLREFDEWAKRQGGPVCGTPMIGILTLTMLGAAVISLVAVVLGVVAYRRSEGPRTGSRTIEVLALGAPLALVAVVAVWSAVSF